MATKEYEYVIRELEPGKFEVKKFDPDTINDGGQPLHTYYVLYNPPHQRGRCDCPAGTYRGTGANDRHVGFVIRWIEGGRQSTILG